MTRHPAQSPAPSPAPSPEPGQLTMTARSVEDVLAMVPVVLGFQPEESVVMLTFGAERPFHARVDLPASDDDLAQVVELLLDPALRHRARRAMFVLYAGDAWPARETADRLVEEFERAGVEVVEALRTDGARWYPAVGTRPGVPTDGVPYDVSAHPFLARAVVEGRITHGSREELRATVASDPARVAGVVAALAALSGLTGEGSSLWEELTWTRLVVERHLGAGTSPSDADVARLLRGMLDPRVRDAAWLGLRRATASRHVELWSDVVRRAPDPLVAAPAAVLALAAWQGGQGALAWCALDRCFDVDPGHSLGGLVAEVLMRAVPPEALGEEG